MRFRFAATLSLAALSLIAPYASGQCPQPDGFSGPCCTQTTPNLPQLPGAQISSLGVCWDHCVPTDQEQIRILWQTPAQTACAQYTAPIDVFDSAGAPIMTGKLVLDYTRTWTEIDPAGNQHQVWRFVAKADMSPVTTAGTVPACPVPACLLPTGAHQTAFFYGYVDYARPCGSLAFRNSIVLHHTPDFFIHKPGLSDRPGSFHADRSYALVGPHSAAAPFIPMNLPAPGGPLFDEAVRKTGTNFCLTEERIGSGALTPFAQGCLSGIFTPAPTQYTLSTFGGTGTCPNPVTGVPSSFAAQFIAFPTLPWPYMVTTSIGCWTDPAAYPGQECAFVNEGLFRYHDACFNPQDYFEIYYGATTIEGWDVAPTPVGIPSKNFIDLADNFSLAVGSPVALPILGSIRPTDHLIYVNVP